LLALPVELLLGAGPREAFMRAQAQGLAYTAQGGKQLGVPTNLIAFEGVNDIGPRAGGLSLRHQARGQAAAAGRESADAVAATSNDVGGGVWVRAPPLQGEVSRRRSLDRPWADADKDLSQRNFEWEGMSEDGGIEMERDGWSLGA